MFSEITDFVKSTVKSTSHSSTSSLWWNTRCGPFHQNVGKLFLVCCISWLCKHFDSYNAFTGRMCTKTKCTYFCWKKFFFGELRSSISFY